MANPRGIPTLPSALIRGSATSMLLEPESIVSAETDPEIDPNGEPIEGQGRASEARPAVPRARRRRGVAPVEKTNKRGLHLTDGVWDRLQLEAIRRRTTISAVAADVLDRNLPRLRIERDA